MLELVTFTGIDAHTDLEQVDIISQTYPSAEFGVLVGSSTGLPGNPLFPPWDVVEQFKGLKGVRKSIHLCGRYARQVAGQEPLELDLIERVNGFDRVQVNLHADEWNAVSITVTRPAVERFLEHAPIRTLIIQHREGWDTVPIDHDRVEYLFDRSEGRGEEGFEHWPPPPIQVDVNRSVKRYGYAGGLGPSNIQRAAGFVARYPAARVWLDMERNIRTPDTYLLDLDRVREVCRLLWS